MRLFLPALFVLCCAAACASAAVAELTDITGAVLVTPATMTKAEQNAADMLLDEVEARTGVRWGETHAWPGDAPVVLALGPQESLASFAGPHAAAFADNPVAGRSEGFRIRGAETGEKKAVVIAGNDARGVLFGVGRLLREMRMSRGRVLVPAGLDIATAPETALRGHQLGYRPKTNSYDAWTAEMWEQYIRDLAVFGANAVELIPPRSDDDADSPHFPLPQLEMMRRMSQICDDHGIDVWVWYPALDKDYSKPETVDAAMAEWGAVFAALPRIDAIFVPGGDPGHTPPEHMMALLERATETLRQTHPKAQMWMSPQGFTKEWMDGFMDFMRTRQPAWLTGIVFGPQNRMKLADLRAGLPQQYPIRHYPDITHTIQCQFPVPDWDYAFAITEQREPVNPRPTQYARIYQMFKEGTIGFLTYSEGCNDDVNKTVWSGLGWDSAAPVDGILREYGRYFISPDAADAFAQGLLALERNWTGPLASNDCVPVTLAQFQEMERNATPQMKLNWRFQQALYRAYYDALVQRRLLYETLLEQEAMDALRRAGTTGTLHALDKAEAALMRAVDEPAAEELRARVFELAEALYQSVRMQLSAPKYQAINSGRGGNLDLIDLPLNDRIWLLAKFGEIRALPTERARLEAVNGIVDWKNPGPGGFYDELGVPSPHSHLLRSAEHYPDPEFKSEPNMGRDYEHGFKISWNRYAESRYESPLQARYGGLDPEAGYTVRVVYAGDSMERTIQLSADGLEVHPQIEKPNPPAPLEFEIPQGATADGSLTLTWMQAPGRGGNGRGCQVAEVWLMKNKP